MTPDALRHAGRLVARDYRLDDAAVVMVGCIAASGRPGSAVPSAEERAELLCIAESSDGIERFIEAATSRAVQFASARWPMILAHAERLAAEMAAVA